MDSNILAIKNLSIIFNTDSGRTEAVRDLSLSIGRGEILAVVGESGCGKSVLCKSVIGLLPRVAEIPSGSIRLGGKELVGLSDQQLCGIRGSDVAMVFQDPMTSLDPACRIGAQIAEAIKAGAAASDRSAGAAASDRPAGVAMRSGDDVRTAASVRAKAVELMEAVGIDRAEERYDAWPWMLSGGMRQRCVLAMALAQDPSLLIADEPTTALDVTVQAEILDLLLRLREERNLSVLFISHDLSVVSKVADRVAIMYAGRIVEEGTTREVLEHPAHPYTWSLLHALPAFARDGKLQPIPGAPPVVPEGFEADAFAERNRWALGIDYVQAPPFFALSPTHRVASWLADPRAPKVDFDAAGMDAEHGSTDFDTEPGSTAFDAEPGRTDTPILNVRQLTHVFRLGRRAQVRAAKDVSFAIRPGEIFALVGESGSGKTTVARCILGWYQPAAGQILYDGTDITGWSGRAFSNVVSREVRSRLAREIQFISQDPGAALDPKMTVRELLREPLQIHGICNGRREQEEYIRQMLREVQLDDNVLDRIPGQLSGGQKQRVSIARAYSMNPRLLVADEPLAALDVSIQAQIVELLQSLQLRHGTSILFISHDLSMVKLIADHVGVLYHGDLVETAETEKLFRSPQHPYTKKLLASMPVLAGGEGKGART